MEMGRKAFTALLLAALACGSAITATAGPAADDQEAATKALLARIEGEWQHKDLKLAVSVKNGVATVTKMETAWPGAEALKLREGLVVLRLDHAVIDRSGRTPRDRAAIAGQCWVERAGVASMKPCLATLYMDKGDRLFFEGFFLKRPSAFTKQELSARR